MENDKFTGFVLRHAAGVWNLLDLTHPEIAYKEPLQINDTGAEIWRKLCEGFSVTEIAESFSGAYEISKEEAHADVCEFVNKLKAYGVPL